MFLVGKDSWAVQPVAANLPTSSELRDWQISDTMRAIKNKRVTEVKRCA